MPATKEDIEVLNQGLPYIRSILAFAIYLRYGAASADTIQRCYIHADVFIDQLKKDVGV